MCSRKDVTEHFSRARHCAKLGTQQKISPKLCVHEVFVLMVGDTVRQKKLSAVGKNKDEEEEDRRGMWDSADEGDGLPSSSRGYGGGVALRQRREQNGRNSGKC